MNNLIAITSQNNLIKLYRLLTNWHIIIGTKIKLIIIDFFVNKEIMAAIEYKKLLDNISNLPVPF